MQLSKKSDSLSQLPYMMKILVLCLVILINSGCKSRPETNTKAAGLKQNDTYNYFVVSAGARNPRNTEAAIMPLKDGTLLLGWTEFYASDGADHGPARISGKISA